MEEIKNLKKAAKRILKAIKNKERIILYGDADLDGAGSVIILKESVQNLGGKVTAVYFFDRETEGHGISEQALNYLKKFAPALFITVDCGIGNFKEIDLANKLGFEVIIIDHHQVLDKLPNASIIVDPKQKGDEYPFKELAATGIVFKLSELLLGIKMTDSLKRNFLELTALATIADMMPQEKDNKIFINQGMASIENSWRPGLETFFQTDIGNLSEEDKSSSSRFADARVSEEDKSSSSRFADARVSEEDKSSSSTLRFACVGEKVSKLISILNIRDLEKGLPASFRLLTSSSGIESQKIIKKLFKKNELKKEKINKIMQEIEWQISADQEPVVFIGSTDWKFSFVSLLASIICNKYKKPTFIFKKGTRESQGAVRTPSDTNSVDLMGKCSKYLLTFGGHPRAAGFKVENKNLERFKTCLIKNS